MRILLLVLAAMVVPACVETEGTWGTGGTAEGGGSVTGGTREGGGNASGTPLPAVGVVYQDYDDGVIPVNGDGNMLPYPYTGQGGGLFTSSLIPEGVSGQALQAIVTSGTFYAQFNPYNNVGNPAYTSPKGWAREYVKIPSAWTLDTFNRLRFWIKVPRNGPPHKTDGRTNFSVGTYVKGISNADRYEDEDDRGGHYYHDVNLPATDTWTQVILNMHPDHRRDMPPEHDWRDEAYYPTGEPGYNYFDTLTRWYINIKGDVPLPAYPANFCLDEIEFYRELNTENDLQIYNVTATYVAATNRVIVCWNRHKDENGVAHEIRYAFSSVHTIGWSAATPVSMIMPPGWQGYNMMVFDSTALPLAGEMAVYIAIKPANSSRFTQVRIPLDLN